jgi:DNA-binding transcriptional regulator YiaG
MTKQVTREAMTTDEIIGIQTRLGLSDGKMAQAIGVTRQTWRNWRRGEKCPKFAQNALIWLMELRRLSPDNDNLPPKIRTLAGFALALMTAF